MNTIRTDDLQESSPGPTDAATPEMVQEIWARRAAQLAQVPVEAEAGEQLELVLVRLGREIYGFAAQYAFDIRPAELITRVPRVPAWVAGVTNLRGRILSVLDLQRFFGLPHAEEAPIPANGSLVVVETPHMALALLVDEVLAVESLPASRMQEAADPIRGLPQEYVQGITDLQYRTSEETAKDSLLVVLDLPALLANERLIVQEEIV